MVTQPQGSWAVELVHEDGDAPVLGTLLPVDQTPTQPTQEGLEDLDPGSTQHTADEEELVSGKCHPAGDEVRLLDEKKARNRLPASCEGHGTSSSRTRHRSRHEQCPEHWWPR